MTDEKHFPIDSVAFQAGDAVAHREIAAGKLRLHFQLRGAWGDDLKASLLSILGVEVIELSCFTSQAARSYEAGYDEAVKAHLESMYGHDCVGVVCREVQERRKKSYDEWLLTNPEAAE